MASSYGIGIFSYSNHQKSTILEGTPPKISMTLEKQSFEDRLFAKAYRFSMWDSHKTGRQDLKLIYHPWQDGLGPY